MCIHSSMRRTLTLTVHIMHKYNQLLVVLFTAEYEVSGYLGHVVGRVDDLACRERNV